MNLHNRRVQLLCNIYLYLYTYYNIMNYNVNYTVYYVIGVILLF